MLFGKTELNMIQTMEQYKLNIKINKTYGMFWVDY